MKFHILRVTIGAAVLLGSFAGRANAIDPPDGTAMGVPQIERTQGQPSTGMTNRENAVQAHLPLAPSQNPGISSNPTLSNPPLADVGGGWYFLRETLMPAKVNGTTVYAVWTVVGGAPNWAQDKSQIGSAEIVNGMSPNGSPCQWSRIRGITPGWVHVTVTWPYQPPIEPQHAWFRFYEIITLEDDAGGVAVNGTQTKLGFDPRYAGDGSSWFRERGGYHFGLTPPEPEPDAEGMFGYNDRYPGDSVSEPAWTRMPLQQGERASRWAPEAMLLPCEQTPLGWPDGWSFNSLVANTRDNQYVRVWLHGPRENGRYVPLHLHCTSQQNGGEVEPGITPGQPPSYDIIIDNNSTGQTPQQGFNPPLIYPQLPGLGEWFWPNNVTLKAPEIRVVKGIPAASYSSTVDDPPPERDGQRKWILRVPWMCKIEEDGFRHLSGAYGDIEVEAKIAPWGYPNGLARIWGADPTGLDEGCMQIRLGTVIELERIKMRVGEPERDDWVDHLLHHWHRRIQPKTRFVVIPTSQVTLSHGTIVRGGREGREDDGALLFLQKRYDTPNIDQTRPMEEQYFKEVTVSAANRMVATNPEPVDWEDSYWVKAEHPSDLHTASWFTSSGALAESSPTSLNVEMRGYLGVIPQNPLAEDYSAEPSEHETHPTTGEVNTTPQTTIQTPVHFINVIGDANNDGLVNDEDDDEELEEGADTAGVIVNESLIQTHADDPATSIVFAEDENLRRFRIGLSTPVDGATYENYEIWITGASWNNSPHGLRVYQGGGASGAILPFDTAADAYVLAVPPSGRAGSSEALEVWLGIDDNQPLADEMLYFALVGSHEEGTNTVKRVEALDLIKVTYAYIGLSADSDNNGLIEWPEDNRAEEEAPGLIVAISDGPQGAGDPAAEKYRYVVEVEGASRGSVEAWAGATAYIYKFGPAAGGQISVWDSAGSQVLNGTAGATNKHEFDAEDFLGTEKLEFLVQGEAVGGIDMYFELVGDSGDVMAFDRIFLSVVQADLTVHNGLDGATGGQEIPALQEYTHGAITVANLNNTNGNSDASGNPIIDADENPVAGECDLVELTLDAPDANIFDRARVEIIKGVGTVGLWDDHEKTTDLCSEGTYSVEIRMADDGSNPFFAGGSFTLWVESQDYSGGLRDIELEYQARIADTESWIPLDKVRATAVWFTQAATGDVWYQTTQTIKPSPISAALDSFLESWRSNGGAYYGPGLFGADWSSGSPAQGDSYIGGRIMERWTMSPADALSVWSNLTADTTRQIESRIWFMYKGAHTFQVDPTTQANFPVDLDQANDDSRSGDPAWEDDELSTDAHVYNYDTPGGPSVRHSTPSGLAPAVRSRPSLWTA